MNAGSRMTMYLLALGAMGLGSAVGCSKPGEDSEAKRTPIPEPAPGASVPSSWSVPVKAAGAKVRNLDAATLNATKPDFADDERKAWRLDRLLSDSEFPLGALVEAIGVDGVGISIRRQDGEDAPVPVIVLTRRGELVAAAVSAKEPFPNYHGQGGRLKRPGDPFPRLISPLARLRISGTGMRTKEHVAPASIEGLLIQIGDNPPSQISSSVLGSVPSSTVLGDSGNKKTQWNVRDLVAASVGESAVLIAVEGDESVAVTSAQWSDMRIRPVLQLNRRGQLKFQWQEDTAAVAGQVVVRTVRLLKLKK
ncbi:MAG: hypothetical protein GY811_21645 [Myxococcales bacterium]|nr:hypothetical protein [Myxococcales bacterium]